MQHTACVCVPAPRARLSLSRRCCACVWSSPAPQICHHSRHPCTGISPALPLLPTHPFRNLRARGSNVSSPVCHLHTAREAFNQMTPELMPFDRPTNLLPACGALHISSLSNMFFLGTFHKVKRQLSPSTQDHFCLQMWSPCIPVCPSSITVVVQSREDGTVDPRQEIHPKTAAWQSKPVDRFIQNNDVAYQSIYHFLPPELFWRKKIRTGTPLQLPGDSRDPFLPWEPPVDDTKHVSTVRFQSVGPLYLYAEPEPTNSLGPTTRARRAKDGSSRLLRSI
jgi:hypothetical protein